MGIRETFLSKGGEILYSPPSKVEEWIRDKMIGRAAVGGFDFYAWKKDEGLSLEDLEEELEQLTHEGHREILVGDFSTGRPNKKVRDTANDIVETLYARGIFDTKKPTLFGSGVIVPSEWEVSTDEIGVSATVLGETISQHGAEVVYINPMVATASSESRKGQKKGVYSAIHSSKIQMIAEANRMGLDIDGMNLIHGSVVPANFPKKAFGPQLPQELIAGGGVVEYREGVQWVPV